jgi:undecaprenyl-diphosphatase
VVLGLLHGPAELLPISSSAHVALVPWLLGWDYGELDPELRKEFEVAVHAGTAAALVIALRAELAQAMSSPRVLSLVAVAAAPPALVGYAFERPIERRLGTPRTIAVGLVVGGLAMAWADRAPRLRSSKDARAGDAALLGLAQACALMPGVSRSGATLAVARLRGFRRADSERLSRHVALPVLVGAAALKAVRLRQRGSTARAAAPFAVGAVAAFCSTLACTRIVGERDRSLAPYAAYRIALAATVLRRLTARPTTMAP